MDAHDASAARPRHAGGRQYHIGLGPGDVADRVLLVGDPARAELTAARFDRIELESRNREFVAFTGLADGLRITAMATGIGPDNMEIALIELCQCVPHPTIIRCGSCGALQPDIGLGDLVVSQGAYRLETTSLQFVGEGYPAVADPEVLLSLIQAADELGVPHHVGITATAPGFYGAQGREIPGFPLRAPGLLDELARQGIKNLEMEISALLALSTLRGLRAGAVCAVFGSRPHDTVIRPEDKEHLEARCVDVGLRAFHNLARLDRARGARPRWHPGLTIPGDPWPEPAG
jgi:uridine phosphorylase